MKHISKNTECLDVDDVDMVYKDYIAEKGDDAYALLADVANKIGNEVIQWADETGLAKGYDEDIEKLIKRLEKFVRNFS